jgi:hypothetical protein
MEKTIVIDGKKVTFKSNGATPMKYKSQFGEDYFQAIFKLISVQKDASKKKLDEINVDDINFNNLDFELFYRMAWVMARTHDPSIPEPEAWLETFDEFPMVEIIPELQELMMTSFQSSKKKQGQKQTKMAKS